MAERSKFTIGVEVINRGSTVVDPKLTACELVVNGVVSVPWNIALGAGARDETWSALPPGKIVTVLRTLGDWLFLKPGTYRLAMNVGSQQSVVDVQVTT